VSEALVIGELAIELTFKAVKHAHLAVHPPDGRISLVVPLETRHEVARAYVISKLAWIRTQQARLAGQEREAPRRFVSRESHFVWGQHHLLEVVECQGKPGVTMDHRRIMLAVRPGSEAAARGRVLHEWHKALLHATVPGLIARWEMRLGVSVRAYFLQRMKTQWGSCNHKAGHIRLNTELVKKPRHLLEYVVVHEMVHLLEPSHNQRFVAILERHWPSWREARLVLNELPLAAEAWPKEGAWY
jgi:predicted metal-dependent hydrolase